jgi:4-hydroxy-tetrahydrodipicolinate reductase
VSARHPVALAGARGRMGAAVERAIGASSDFELVHRADRSLAPGAGAGPDLSTVAAGFVSGIIDFTSAQGAAEAAVQAVRIGCPLVSGSTGLDVAARGALEDASRLVPVCWSPNFSLGIPLLVRALRAAARALPEGCQMEIAEIHHSGKRDAPSGTALRLADTWKAQRGGRLVHGRQGMVGPREDDEIGMHALRIGDVVGEHRILLGVPGEMLEAIHRVQDRTAFAAGSLEALRRLMRQGPGWFEWEELLCGD